MLACWNGHEMADQERSLTQGVSIPTCVFMYFHYITIAETVFCPPYGPYLRNCLCDLAESWLVGATIRWLMRNTHVIKGVSSPICGFMFLHHVPIANTI